MYIGVTTKGKGTILESDLSPEQIVNRDKKEVLSNLSFTDHSTNWSGCDDIERICDIKNIKCVDRIELTKPLVFRGSDYDSGHTYEWSIKVVEIRTVAYSYDSYLEKEINLCEEIYLKNLVGSAKPGLLDANDVDTARIEKL